MLNAKSILSLSIFIIFKLIYTVSTFYRTRQALSFLFPTSIQRKHNEECLHQLSQMGKFENLKKLEKLKPYALQIDIQPKRLLAITYNDRRE